MDGRCFREVTNILAAVSWKPEAHQRPLVLHKQSTPSQTQAHQAKHSHPTWRAGRELDLLQEREDELV